MNKSRIMLIAALAVAVASCSGSGEEEKGKEATSTTVEHEAFETNINIRYVVMDSIQKHYVLAQNVASKANGLVSELQTYQIQLQNQLQSQANQIQQKAQNNGYLSQASYEADMKELQKKSDSYQRLYAQREQNAALAMEALQKELTDSINNFIGIYNKEKKYDAILFKDAGLYFNPQLDITQEVLDGLNKRFKGEALVPEGGLDAPKDLPEAPSLDKKK